MPPCFTIVLNTVSLEKLTSKELLKKAIELVADRITGVNADLSRITFTKGGYSFTIANGKLECQQGQEGVGDLIKQSYSGVAVVQAAKKFGWTVKPLKKNKMQLTRRF